MICEFIHVNSFGKWWINMVGGGNRGGDSHWRRFKNGGNFLYFLHLKKQSSPAG